jgi:hypothetical protein
MLLGHLMDTLRDIDSERRRWYRNGYKRSELPWLEDQEDWIRIALSTIKAARPPEQLAFSLL